MSYSVYVAVMWPSISLLSDNSTYGTAFGIAVSTINLANSLIPTIGNLIFDL